MEILKQIEPVKVYSEPSILYIIYSVQPMLTFCNKESDKSE
jgi:hypothetical protein